MGRLNLTLVTKKNEFGLPTYLFNGTHLDLRACTWWRPFEFTLKRFCKEFLSVEGSFQTIHFDGFFLSIVPAIKLINCYLRSKDQKHLELLMDQLLSEQGKGRFHGLPENNLPYSPNEPN